MKLIHKTWLVFVGLSTFVCSVQAVVPGITAVSPEPGQTNVATDNPLQLQFSASVGFEYTEGRYLEVRDLSTGAVVADFDPVKGDAATGSQLLQFSAEQLQLKPGRQYQVTLDSGFARMNAAPWKTSAIAAGVWTFSTAKGDSAEVGYPDITGLNPATSGIVGVYPAPGSVVDEQHSLIHIQFSGRTNFKNTGPALIRVFDKTMNALLFSSDPEGGDAEENSYQLNLHLPQGSLKPGHLIEVQMDHMSSRLDRSPWTVRQVPAGVWTFSVAGFEPEPEPDPDPEPTPDPELPTEPGAEQPLMHPLVYVTQLPVATGASDFLKISGAFGSHLPDTAAAPRGGSLMIKYPDGENRDLLAAALAETCRLNLPACDDKGVLQLDANGLMQHGYAAREPMVHWSGDRVVVSLLKGARLSRFGAMTPDAHPKWQLYEVLGLAQQQQPVLRKVPHQDSAYNYLSPVYASAEGEIIFTTDRPVTGDNKHYPQLDEYESQPTVSGIWKLNTQNGQLSLLDHSPSGSFTPFVGQDGMLYFTRWDHLQQDQQALNSVGEVLSGTTDYWQSYTYADENQQGKAHQQKVSAQIRAGLDSGSDQLAFNVDQSPIPEHFSGHPVWSSRADRIGQRIGSYNGRDIVSYTPEGRYGRENGLRFNVFLPWQMQQDGMAVETLRHVGRHELQNYFESSLLDDANLRSHNGTATVRDGLFQFTQSASNPKLFLGVLSNEFNSHTSGAILQIEDTDPSNMPHENGSALRYRLLTDPNGDLRYRNPQQLADGRLIAAVDEIKISEKTGVSDFYQFRFKLYELKLDAATGFYKPYRALINEAPRRKFSYWDNEGQLRQFDGELWQLSAQEVKPRAVPSSTAGQTLAEPEQQIFNQLGLDVSSFRQYLQQNNLALIVSRNVTKRDAADSQQPFNLRIAQALADGSVTQTVKPGSDLTKIYQVSHLELFENKLVRGYGRHNRGEGASYTDGGRRGLPRPMREIPDNFVMANPERPSAINVAADGSVAALVPAGRAITWMLSDSEHNPLVRERYWLTFASGEIRVCASCHGINDKAQDGSSKPVNSPEALKVLLENWKQNRN